MKSSPDNTLSLEETLKAILPDGKLSGKLPPVDSWNPQNCGDIDMAIRADGSWWHEGGRMNRERMVKMFSRILRKDEDGKTYLVTPYEKVVVDVEDAPFIAVRVDRAGEAGPQQALAFLTNVGDVAVAGPDNPIRVETDAETGEPAPYVLVRGRLEAKIARPAFYELVDMAEADPKDETVLGVWSQGVFFPIGAAA
ncbi:DUF1285 domain-containing protein [Hyphomonas oceanitis]|uniref:DUF1285 domain-containing protein n=1 Tax=Hyphomonas oceanitis SCH89 TaxID=1280953 RepID=A0A059GCB6_9PROT|nr:DUF1285 domain-containing protein [Hyphomonas oceanitis]KDA04442.1 hypothetical protein HOC_01125 [Hyphomonas oceanitis SCH89]